MGRLIDESEAIELIKGSDELTDHQKDESITCIRACNTAYDPDKVVEQLKKEKNPIYRADGSLMTDRSVIKIDKAIEIVKGGGVEPGSECLWKLEDAEANLYEAGCANLRIAFHGTLEENLQRYCQCCGKKIRVVK